MPKPRKRFRRRESDPRCCAEVAEDCPPSGACCTAQPLRQGAVAACAILSTPQECGRGYPDGGEPANEYCTWLGGRCVLGASSDCREAYDPHASSYYGEVQGF